MNTTQPEAFCWATELAMVRDPVTLTVKEAREVSDEMQRMHAELETLRAKLKTYEDLGDAGSDVQLLRTGYAAARLEIESLRDEVKEYRHAAGVQKTLIATLLAEKPAGAQQPGAARQAEALCIAESLDAVPETGADPQTIQDAAAELRRLHTELETLHASHERAPAQAAPAAVAGPSGYGPKVTVKRRCSDCKACNSESYAVQGDSGHYVYCEHPSLPERKYIGDTRWDTPGWCPAAAPTTKPAPQQGEGRNLQAVINAAADKLDAAKRCHQSAVDTLIDEALEILDGDRDPHKPAPQQEAQEPILYDPKALLEVFQNAQAGSSCPAGTLRGIAAVIASWESREPHTLIAAPQPSPAAQGDARSMLRIVADYSDWLDSKGRLTSFSTFVNEFGYEERDCKSVYEIVVVPCLAARAAQEDKSHDNDTQLAPTDAEIDALLRHFYASDAAAEMAKHDDRLTARAVLARWGQPAHSGEPFAWTDDGSTRSGAITTSHRVVTHETKKAMPRAAAESFNVPLYLAPQPQAGVVPLTDEQIDAAAKKLAECMEYPWEFMPAPGRKNMRKHAQDVIDAAHGIKGGQHGTDT